MLDGVAEQYVANGVTTLRYDAKSVGLSCQGAGVGYPFGQQTFGSLRGTLDENDASRGPDSR